MPDNVEAWIKEIVEAIYEGKQMPDQIHGPLTNWYAEKLWQAVVEGYGKDLPIATQWNTPDTDMLLSLKRDVYQFSGAKNYTQLKALTEALIGPDDKLRTKADFYKEAFKINNEQVRHHLDAERNLAIASGQMASKWVGIQKDKELFPFLYYDAVLDEGTTQLCLSFDGILLSVDHPFWNEYYPPNHFGCRSTVQKRTDGEETDTNSIVYPPKMPAMFKVNLAKRQLAFPPAHPYWQGIPADAKKQALRLMPYNEQFNQVDKKGTGWVRRHLEVDTNAADYSVVERIAIDKMNEGVKADIMPIAHQTDPALRAIIFPDAKGPKNPDLRLDGILHELKRVSKLKANTIKHAIASASQQADHVIIVLPGLISDEQLSRYAKSKFIDHKDLAVIEFVMGSTYKSFSRSAFK